MHSYKALNLLKTILSYPTHDRTSIRGNKGRNYAIFRNKYIYAIKTIAHIAT